MNADDTHQQQELAASQPKAEQCSSQSSSHTTKTLTKLVRKIEEIDRLAEKLAPLG